eukprot:257397-Pleurochrysis_carterae.AAC.1
MSLTDWEEMRADHALQREEDMARAEAIQAEARGDSVRPDGPSAHAEAHAMRVRTAAASAANTERPATDTTYSNAHAKRTAPKGGSPKVSPTPSDGAM